MSSLHWAFLCWGVFGGLTPAWQKPRHTPTGEKLPLCLRLFPFAACMLFSAAFVRVWRHPWCYGSQESRSRFITQNKHFANENTYTTISCGCSFVNHYILYTLFAAFCHSQVLSTFGGCTYCQIWQLFRCQRVASALFVRHSRHVPHKVMIQYS